MGGLIPLLLPTSTATRPGAVATKRPVSVMATQGSVISGHRRQQSLPLLKPMKRLSVSLPPTTPVLPDTPEEWKRTVNEVKRKYVSRKYRTCSARCSEILDSLSDTSKVETLHLVYLHFYAASSSEMCARPLSQSSAYRTKLLDDAREHYDKASSLIKEAEEAAVHRTRSASSASTTPSLHSQSPSDGSRSSSVCTFLSSPRNSISSVEDLMVRTQSAKPKKKKKVSFSGLLEIEIPECNWQPEPYIRPDSPTLGWEGGNLLFGQIEYAPQSVVTHVAPKPIELISPKESASIESETASATTLATVPEEHQIEDSFDLESFLQVRSTNRIVSQLSALRSQVAWHRDNIDTLMTEAEEIPEVPETPTVPGLSHSGSSSSSTADIDEQPSPPPSATLLTPHTFENALSKQLKDSFGNGPGFDLSARLSLCGGAQEQHAGYPEAWDRSRSASVCSARSSFLPPRSSSQLSMRSTGDDTLQSRIARLRASGWQRKRFDSRRYEALREQVLGELGS